MNIAEEILSHQEESSLKTIKTKINLHFLLREKAVLRTILKYVAMSAYKSSKVDVRIGISKNYNTQSN